MVKKDDKNLLLTARRIEKEACVPRAMMDHSHDFAVVEFVGKGTGGLRTGDSLTLSNRARHFISGAHILKGTEYTVQPL